ncbi:MAG: bifunctional 4-hydroxy-3-methylbut-2-enyl diphosphate reductase/30S ribosomal protein S1 [Oscillospiraceae bacterium]
MITLAKSAGFCFGVDRAVKLVYSLLEQGNKVTTLGPIIHNAQLVEDLSKKGVRIIENPQEAKDDEVVVIRSHGVDLQTMQQLENKKYVDATCPFVQKIHNIVSDMKSGVTIIAGDNTHPEVCGIKGHCTNKNFVISNVIELEELVNKLTSEEKKNIIMVAQTTFNKTMWQECNFFLKKVCTNAKIFDTICSATNMRQDEAFVLSKQCDLMIVVGGKHSSNTKKLYQICCENTKTFLIETKKELANLDILCYDKIGVTAGASTPAYIIKEVLKTMSEILRNEESELDFATLLEQSLETEKIYNGKRVTGIVTSVNQNEVHVDIGAKQAGIIPADELTDDPTAKPEDIVKKGDEIQLAVMKVNDQEGIVLLSKKQCDALVGFENLKKAYEEEAVIDGIITDVVRGGVLVYALNAKLFVPASQCSDRHVEDLNTLLKQKVKLKIIEINEAKNRAKGSVKAVTVAAKKEAQAKFWAEAEIGKKYQGEVKSITPYGAFVDLGGIDGMIHITELSWSKIKSPAEIVKVGETVEVYIKDMDKDKKRISLGYKNSAENPWILFLNKYKVEDVAEVRIVSFTSYGAFAEIIPGVDGLIHISQIANKRVDKIADVLKVGDVVNAKIVEIDEEKKRVSLSIKALLVSEEPAEESEDAE